MTLGIVLPGGGGGGGGAPANVPGVANFVIDGLGAPILPGDKADIWMPFTGLWVGVTLLADVPGNAVVDLWQTTYGLAPPTVLNSIVAGSPPTLAAAQKYQDLALAGWTVNFGPNSVLRCHVNSAATIGRLTVALSFLRT